MTKNERAVFNGLQTEDDRRRFQSLFWKVRDATPGTPENEFRSEYYRRRRYAENRLEGAQSDRGQIFTLPEREIERSYLRYFSSPAGTAEVSYSAKQIAGKAAVFLTECEGVKFVNYSLMPDRISTVRTKEGLETAQLVFHMRVEDRGGKTIYQQEKEIRINLDEPQYEVMIKRKFIFNDFSPIIEGEFRVSLAFSNKTSQEFFVEELAISTGRLWIVEIKTRPHNITSVPA
jgi:GWxTD domain-containing protein